MAHAIYRFLLKRTGMDLFIKIDSGIRHMKKLAKEMGINYFHLTNVVNAYKGDNIFKKIKVKKGHEQEIFFTELGEKITYHLKEIKKLLDGEVKEEQEEETETEETDEKDILKEGETNDENK